MHERSEIAAAVEAQPEGLTRLYLIAALVLVLITALEVSTVLVFRLPPPVRAGILIVLALMKASLIGAYYMNLKFERLAMAYIAIIPLTLLILMLFSILPDAAQLIRHR